MTHFNFYRALNILEMLIDCVHAQSFSKKGPFRGSEIHFTLISGTSLEKYPKHF
jgi:hypothetical protein